MERLFIVYKLKECYEVVDECKSKLYAMIMNKFRWTKTVIVSKTCMFVGINVSVLSRIFVVHPSNIYQELNTCWFIDIHFCCSYIEDSNNYVPLMVDT